MTITTNTNYMKKNLQLTALAFALAIGSMSAQTGKISLPQKSASKTPTQNQKQVLANNPALPNPVINQALTRGCGTPPPSAEWDAWFNKEVEKYIAANATSKIQTAYTIPVVFHIIHTGQAVGSYPNLAQGQVNSQVTVLNQDYASAGLNSANCPTTFTAAKANTQVTFCLATKNPSNTVLAEPGIDRIACSSKGWTNPASFTSMGTFQSYVDGTIKPQSIWDPTRYFNVWVTDCNSSVGLLGYATFPAGTGLTGLSGFGTATTDGVWVYSAGLGAKAIFPTGTYATPYDQGRTLTHESGHWLGLRHIWGDGTCLTDYCNDTPPAQTSNFSCSTGCTSGCFTHPYKMGVCSGNTTGEMTMNFMDYTDDKCMYMFTNDQNTRIQTAMANGTYRNQLSTSAATLCVSSPAAPVSSFNMTTSVCSGTTHLYPTTNSSTGNPTPTFSWSSVPAAGVIFNPSSTATTPSISFTSNGTYTITCKATNTVGTNSSTKVITAGTCTVAAASCNDTLTNLLNTDTLTLYTGGGYVGGNNSYGDLEKAEWYSSTGLVGSSKIMGGIVIFYRHATANIGTKGTSGITFKVYNGNNVTGPSGAAINTFTNTITNILAAATATNNVQYCGNPTLAYSTNIMRPYSFNFAAPTNISGDFLIGCTTSTLTGDTIAIFSSTGNTASASTAWELQTGPTWVAFNDGTSASWQLNSSLAILPKIACVTDIYNVNGISGNIAIFPNPSNGVFNFAVTMPQASDLNFTVMNSIGQVVYTKVERGVTSTVINMNLSHLSKGIYFVNIIDSTGDKVTKKIIIE
jgi:hypothetical protein